MIPSKNVSTNKFFIGILAGKFIFNYRDLLYVLSLNRKTVHHFILAFASAYFILSLKHTSFAFGGETKQREREREKKTKRAFAAVVASKSNHSNRPIFKTLHPGILISIYMALQNTLFNIWLNTAAMQQKFPYF